MKDGRRKVSVLTRVTIWDEARQVVHHGYIGEYKLVTVDPKITFHHGDSVRFQDTEMLPDPVGHVFNGLYAIPEYIFNCFVFSE